jgi:hypothetical protein
MLFVGETGALSAPAEAEGPRNIAGIASEYPGDTGIERDSRVIFAENFEEASPDELFARWETVADPEGMKFSADIPTGSSC